MPRRVAHFGTFDVENFGDLLFPLVIERRLAGAGTDSGSGLGSDFEITHVSPVGGPPVWGDCVRTISTEEALSQSFDAIVVGGGHLIHGQAPDVEPYRSAGDAALFAYADLWLGATLHGCRLGVPIVWNAPGVPGALSPEVSALACWAAGQADHLGVRDETSREFLQAAGFAGEIAVELDTALDVARLWSDAELDAAWGEAFEARGQTPAPRTLALHFSSRYLQDGISATAGAVDDLCRSLDAKAILLGLGPCHGDSALQAEIAEAMETAPLVVDAPRSLREVAACLRGSQMYVGSSLHGAVTATAFGRPAILVARETTGGHAKFSGFLASQDIGSEAEEHPPLHHVEAWADGLGLAKSLVVKPIAVGPASDRMRANEAALDRYWERVEQALRATPEDLREARGRGLVEFEALVERRWTRASDYVGILLDQARAAAGFRDRAQANARRFRELDRVHRDLVESSRAKSGWTRVFGRGSDRGQE